MYENVLMKGMMDEEKAEKLVAHELRGVRILLRTRRECSYRGSQVVPEGQNGPIGEFHYKKDGIRDDERSCEPDVPG